MKFTIQHQIQRGDLRGGGGDLDPQMTAVVLIKVTEDMQSKLNVQNSVDIPDLDRKIEISREAGE